MWRSGAIALSIAVAMTGCDVELDEGVNGRAVVEPDCAPTDGPAFTLHVGLEDSGGSACAEGFADPNQRLTMTVFEPFATDTLYTFVESGNESGAGRIQLTRGGETITSFEEAIVDFQSEDDDGDIIGSYTITLLDGTIVVGLFTAEFCDDPVVCG